jgi:hypothetical protein
LVITRDNISKREYRGDMAFRPYSFSDYLAPKLDLMYCI